MFLNGWILKRIKDLLDMGSYWKHTCFVWTALSAPTRFCFGPQLSILQFPVQCLAYRTQHHVVCCQTAAQHRSEQQMTKTQHTKTWLTHFKCKSNNISQAANQPTNQETSTQQANIRTTQTPLTNAIDPPNVFSVAPEEAENPRFIHRRAFHWNPSASYPRYQAQVQGSPCRGLCANLAGHHLEGDSIDSREDALGCGGSGRILSAGRKLRLGTRR